MKKPKTVPELIEKLVQFIDYDIWKDWYCYPETEEEKEEVDQWIKPLEKMVENFIERQK